MTIDEAIEVLELHNRWRKGAEIPMETPIRIGMAIDLVVCELKTLRIANVSGYVCKGCKFDKKCNLQDEGRFKEICRHFEKTDQ